MMYVNTYSAGNRYLNYNLYPIKPIYRICEDPMKNEVLLFGCGSNEFLQLQGKTNLEIREEALLEHRILAEPLKLPPLLSSTASKLAPSRTSSSSVYPLRLGYSLDTSNLSKGMILIDFNNAHLIIIIFSKSSCF